MRINLTKKDLVNLIYMQLGFSKQVSENLIKHNNYEIKSKISKAENLIKSLNIDEVTPKEALHILYKLQSSILKN